MTTKHLRDHKFDYRRGKRKSKKTDQIVIDTKPYEKEDRTGRIYFCMYCHREMYKISHSPEEWYCSRCDVAISPDKEVLRERTTLTTAKEDIEPAVSTTDEDDFHNVSSTNYGRPLKIRGGLKALQDSGIHITSYSEKDGSGRTMTHQMDDDDYEDYEEEDYD